MKAFRFFVLLALSLPQVHGATTQTLHLWKHIPSASELRKIYRKENQKVRVLLRDPDSIDLAALADLPSEAQAARFELVIEGLPNHDTHSSWEAALLPLRTTWIAATLPSPDDWSRLKKIPLHSLHFVVSQAPTALEIQGLRDWTQQSQIPLEITFALGQYPKFMDRDWIENIPVSVPLRWVVDFWPGYVQMDTLNLLKRSVGLRITGGTQWNETDSPYLENLQSLDKTLWESPVTEDLPRPAPWELKAQTPFVWIATGPLWSTTEIERFAASSSKADRRFIWDTGSDSDNDVPKVLETLQERYPRFRVEQVLDATRGAVRR